MTYDHGDFVSFTLTFLSTKTVSGMSFKNDALKKRERKKIFIFYQYQIFKETLKFPRGQSSKVSFAQPQALKIKIISPSNTLSFISIDSWTHNTGRLHIYGTYFLLLI